MQHHVELTPLLYLLSLGIGLASASLLPLGLLPRGNHSGYDWDDDDDDADNDNNDNAFTAFENDGDGDRVRLSDGALAGIIIGSVLGGLLLGALLALCCRRRRRDNPYNSQPVAHTKPRSRFIPAFFTRSRGGAGEGGVAKEVEHGSVRSEEAYVGGVPAAAARRSGSGEKAGEFH